MQVYDYGHAADGTFYYVMEYLPGLTLEQLVERHGPLPANRAIHFLRRGVCGALRKLCISIGLIHRDIKPGNVMICRRGGRHDPAKLLDFGLVIPLGKSLGAKLTQEGAIAGTPAYMSRNRRAVRKRWTPGATFIASVPWPISCWPASRRSQGGPASRRRRHLYRPPAP